MTAAAKSNAKRRDTSHTSDSPKAGPKPNTRATGLNAVPANAPETRSIDSIARDLVSEQAARSGHGPLPGPIRDKAETSLGADFSGVRLHKGRGADHVTRSLGTDAAQFGQHVFVRPDRYNPSSPQGQSLLGHELVHVAQHQNNSPSGADLSRSRHASEQEARALGNHVLSAKSAGETAPTARPATINLNGGDPATDVADLPPQVCEPDAFTGPTNMSVDPSAEGEAEEDDGVITIDPTSVDVSTLTNLELIHQGIEAREQIALFTRSDDESAAWEQLNQDVERERQVRVNSGFVFMAVARDSVPERLFELVPGSIPGTTAIYVAFPETALGPVDATLLGIILTQDQLDAYLETAGLMAPDSPETTRAMEILRTGDAEQLNQEFAAQGEQPQPFGPFDQQDSGTIQIFNPQDSQPRTAGYGPNFSFSRVNRNPLANEMMTVGHMPEWIMPLHARSNTIGHMGEAYTYFGQQADGGRGAFNLNLETWTDITGRQQTSNTPLTDVLIHHGIAPNQFGGRPTSVAATTQEQYAATRFLIDKMAQMLDVHGRRLEATTQVQNTPDLADAHVRQFAQDSSIQPGTAAFADAQRRFLGDTMFAVPDTRVADMRAAIGQPFTSADGSRRPAMLEGYRAVYDQVLSDAPITGTRKDGTTVTIRSYKDLVAVLPNSMRTEGQRVAGGPGQSALTTGSRARVIDLMGRMAASRVVSQNDAAAMVASADRRRGVGNQNSTAPETRILSINRQNFSDTGRRMRDALNDTRMNGEPGEMRWVTNRARSRSDNYLSALRHLTGNQNLQRRNPDGTPNAQFVEARAALTQEILISIPDDQRAPLIDAVLNGDSVLAQDIRAAVNADSPIAQNADLPAFFDNATTTFGVDSASINRGENYFQGVESAAHLSSDGLTLAMQENSLAGIRQRARGNLGRNIWGTALGYGTTMTLDAVSGRPVQAPTLGQAAFDVTLGLASEEAERLAAAQLAQRVPIANTLLRGTAAKAAPGFIIQPLVSFGMGEYAMHQDREGLYREMGVTMSDEEISSRRRHNIGVGLAGAGASALVMYTAAGAVGGPPGMLVGFLIGAGSIIAGATVSYLADRALPGSREEWVERHIKEMEARVEAERQRQQQIQNEIDQGLRPSRTYDQDQIPIPYRTSDRISAQEQHIIAEFFLHSANLGNVPAEPLGPLFTPENGYTPDLDYTPYEPYDMTPFYEMGY